MIRGAGVSGGFRRADAAIALPQRGRCMVRFRRSGNASTPQYGAAKAGNAAIDTANRVKVTSFHRKASFIRGFWTWVKLLL